VQGIDDPQGQWTQCDLRKRVGNLDQDRIGRTDVRPLPRKPIVDGDCRAVQVVVAVAKSDESLGVPKHYLRQGRSRRLLI
jgi:hypothetical protein